MVVMVRSSWLKFVLMVDFCYAFIDLLHDLMFGLVTCGMLFVIWWDISVVSGHMEYI
jgi:hypothetical protein